MQSVAIVVSFLGRWFSAGVTGLVTGVQHSVNGDFGHLSIFIIYLELIIFLKEHVIQQLLSTIY